MRTSGCFCCLPVCLCAALVSCGPSQHAPNVTISHRRSTSRPRANCTRHTISSRFSAENGPRVNRPNGSAAVHNLQPRFSSIIFRHCKGRRIADCCKPATVGYSRTYQSVHMSHPWSHVISRGQLGQGVLHGSTQYHQAVHKDNRMPRDHILKAFNRTAKRYYARTDIYPSV
jgi:hypothetical protein